MSRHAVIGYDKDANGADAIALGALLCEALDAKPTVVTVVKIPGFLLGSADAQSVADDVTRESHAVVSDRLDDLGVETLALPAGSEPKRLFELIEEEDPIVAVVGSSRHGPFGRVLMGSVTEALLTGGTVPIVVAPRGYANQAERRLHEIGVAYDGSQESRSALRAAASLAERLDGSLTIITVAEPPHYGYGSTITVLSGMEYMPAEQGEKDRVLEEAVAELPDGLETHPRRLTGDPADELAKAAANLDLLVVGSRGYGMVKRVLLGGVSARLMRTAPCPVVVLPRSVGDDALKLTSARNSQATAR